MDKKFTVKATLAALLISFSCLNAFSQANIKVRILTISTTGSVDCDGFLSGNSDFAFEYNAADNTIGLSNNNPTAFGLT